MSTSLIWRSAHAWLRGYSDAKAGRPQLKPDELPWPVEVAEPQYSLGYVVGSGALDAQPAYDTSGREQCQV